jgi:hypothetical protein
MKFMGFSFVTLLLFAVFYLIGAKYPGPANKIFGAM